MSEQVAQVARAMDPPFEELFDKAQGYFEEYIRQLRSYGIEPDPNMELHLSTGMNSNYDLSDRQIYLAIPSTERAVGKLYLSFLKSLLQTESDAEIYELFDLLLPRIVAHEIGHSLRHRYGRFDKENLWYEEQLANQLAMALIKRKMSPEKKRRVRRLLSEAISKLEEQVEGGEGVATDSYRDVLHSLNVTEQIGDSMLSNIEVMREVFAIETQELLHFAEELPAKVLERLEKRGEVIEEINEEYTKDAARYIYSHFGWMYVDFLSKQSEYVDEFSVNHLGLEPDLLDEIDPTLVPDRVEIEALFRAAKTLPAEAQLGRRFFYKRYRAALLRRLETTDLNVPRGRVTAEVTKLVEAWDEQGADALDLLELPCPPELKRLFPRNLAQDEETMGLPIERFLPTDTDEALWAYFRKGETDEGVENTVDRMGILESIPLFRPLPVELHLWLIHRMYRLKLEPGEPVLWMGEKNNDLFVLMDGLLEIQVEGTGEGQSEHVDLVTPGDIFGEISFVTNEAASSNVRAVRPSECFVFKGADLTVMSFNHPSVLVQCVTSLGDKLERMSQRVVSQDEEKTVVLPASSTQHLG